MRARPYLSDRGGGAQICPHVDLVYVQDHSLNTNTEIKTVRPTGWSKIRLVITGD